MNLKTRLSVLAGLALAFLIATSTITIIPRLALADPPHCSRSGYPSCYDVGFADGRADAQVNSRYKQFDPNHSSAWRQGYVDGWNSMFPSR